MAYFGILAAGIFAGIIFGKATIFLTSIENAKKYPLGGVAPSALIVMDLGQDSAVLGIGVLTLGGLFGYYLLVSIWGAYIQKGPATRIIGEHSIQKAASLKDYLD